MSGSFSPVPPAVQAVMHPGYDPNTWYGSISSGTVGTTTAVTADILYFFPIQVMKRQSFVSLAIRVGTAVPGVLGKLALYDGMGTGATGSKSLVAEGVGTVDMNATAGTSVALNFVAPVTINPGWVWVGSLFNGAAQPNTMSQASIAAHGLAPWLGAATPAGAVGIVSGFSHIRFFVSQAYSQGFPSLISSVSRTGTSPGSPAGALLTAP